MEYILPSTRFAKKNYELFKQFDVEHINNSRKLILQLSNIFSTINEAQFVSAVAKNIYYLTSVNGVRVMSPSFIKIVGNVKGVSYTFQSESLVVIIYYFSLLPKELELIELIIDIAKTHIKSIMEHNKVLHESFFDSLSGAYNRQTGLELLSKVFLSIKREDKEAYLAFLDIDDLKKYNDNFGHAKGDELIKDFSQAVLKSIRKNDIFVRYGGDEFLLYIDSKEPENVIKRIKFSTNAEFSYGFVPLRDFDTLENAIIVADSKMYELKNAKRFQIYRNI